MPPTGAAQPGNGVAIAGMVLGIISLGLFCVWYVAIPCAVVGLILSAVGLKKSKEIGGKGKGMATTGLVLSVIALGLAIVLAIAVGAFLFTMFEESKTMQEQLKEQMEEMEPIQESLRYLRHLLR
jgi:uncharacterized protein YneF (UPF0154 family)